MVKYLNLLVLVLATAGCGSTVQERVVETCPDKCPSTEIYYGDSNSNTATATQGPQGPQGNPGPAGAPGSSGLSQETYYVKNAVVMVQPDEMKQLNVTCDAGDIAVSGGCQWGKVPHVVEAFVSRPMFDYNLMQPSGWECQGVGASLSTNPDVSEMILATEVICAKATL